MASKPEVFIIESLNFDDEENDRFEGKILSQILALSGKRCEYYYIRTQRELEVVLGRFSKSNYRYLHLSCHGSDDGRALHTTLDRISFQDVGRILKPHIRNRRLFLSACAITNHVLAKVLMPDSGCNSILGPKGDICFHTAPLVWATLYYMMFSLDDSAMKTDNLVRMAIEVSKMFHVHLNYIRRNDKNGYTLRSIVRAAIVDKS